MKELPIIVKADVQGSAEVLGDTLTKLSDEKVKVRIIHSGVGAINESDVLLATASNAIIIGFNVRPDRNAADVAEREKVDVRLHSVIYNVVDEMKKAMTGLLDPTFKEVRIGAAQVRETFKTPKFGTIAGCMVTEGSIKRSGDTQARLIRDGAVVFEGKIGSLRRFKDDVSEVKTGFECGIGFEKYNDLQDRRRDRGVRDRARRHAGLVRMANSRPERVGDQIRVEITGMLTRQVHDPGIGFLTVTRCEVSADLQHARVYYTTLGDEKARRESARALERASPFLRRQLAGRLRLRRAPELLFFFDESVERHDRIERILRDLEQERASRPPDERGDCGSRTVRLPPLTESPAHDDRDDPD